MGSEHPHRERAVAHPVVRRARAEKLRHGLIMTGRETQPRPWTWVYGAPPLLCDAGPMAAFRRSLVSLGAVMLAVGGLTVAQAPVAGAAAPIRPTAAPPGD